MDRLPYAMPPACTKCGKPAERIGQLPEIGLHRLMHVYRGAPCREIIPIETGK